MTIKISSLLNDKRIACYLPCFVVVVISIFCVEGILGLKANLGGDATQNFLSSYNLYSNSEYGRHIGSAGFRREPFPNWILASFMYLVVRPPRGLAEDQILSLQNQIDLMYIDWTQIKEDCHETKIMKLFKRKNVESNS